jgi:hypothetical protein
MNEQETADRFIRVFDTEYQLITKLAKKKHTVAAQIIREHFAV